MEHKETIGYANTIDEIKQKTKTFNTFMYSSCVNA